MTASVAGYSIPITWTEQVYGAEAVEAMKRRFDEGVVDDVFIQSFKYEIDDLGVRGDVTFVRVRHIISEGQPQ